HSTVSGGVVSITADADGDRQAIYSAASNFFSSLSLAANVALATSTATIDVGSYGNIVASNLTMVSSAFANAQGTALSEFLPVSVAYGQSAPTATVNIHDNATI